MKKKEESCATFGGVRVLVLVWSFWYIFGDHDALALCYLGGAAIYLDAIFDEPCYTLELVLMP